MFLRLGAEITENEPFRGRARFRRQPAPAAASRQPPAARRRAGSLKTVYVGERWHGGQHLFCNALRGNLG